MSPDPYAGSYDVTNPQSMNRYAYVQNGPTTATDPEGLVMPILPPGVGYMGGGGLIGGIFNGGDEFSVIQSNTVTIGDDDDSYSYSNSYWTNLMQGGYGPGDDVLADGTVMANGINTGWSVTSGTMAGLLFSSAPTGNVTTLQGPGTSKPTLLQQVKQKMLNHMCSDSGTDKMLSSSVDGGIDGLVGGALEGAFDGGIGGVAFGGVGAVPGAILGAVIGGVVGASGGVITGGAMAATCSLFNVY
jgi:hypothetical protein